MCVLILRSQASAADAGIPAKPSGQGHCLSSSQFWPWLGGCSLFVSPCACGPLRQTCKVQGGVCCVSPVLLYGSALCLLSLVSCKLACHSCVCTAQRACLGRAAFLLVCVQCVVVMCVAVCASRSATATKYKLAFFSNNLAGREGFFERAAIIAPRRVMVALRGGAAELPTETGGVQDVLADTVQPTSCEDLESLVKTVRWPVLKSSLAPATQGLLVVRAQFGLAGRRMQPPTMNLTANACQGSPVCSSGTCGM